jgi:D-glycero-beta-D-manno-heptose-7-phosphate kinase
VIQSLPSVHPLPGEHEHATRLLSLVDAFSARSVLVVGDLIADEFIYGQIARVSREAPVLILDYDSTQVVAGGAGNAANNVAALGGRVHLFGLIGRDEAGRRLVRSLQPNVAHHGILRPRAYRTPTKTRILAGGVHSAKQQVVRIDRAAGGGLEEGVRSRLERSVLQAAGLCDAILVSDYGFGLATPDLVARLMTRIGERTRRRPVPILIDSRYALLDYRGLTACTPNESEVEQLLGVRIDEDLDILEKAGRTLLRRLRMDAVLVTRGSRGMALFEPGRPTVHITIYGTDEIADVTGAGDTVIATMTLALASGASFYEGARLANYAGGLVVMKRGTATVSDEELRRAIMADHQTGVPRSSR